MATTHKPTTSSVTSYLDTLAIGDVIQGDYTGAMIPVQVPAGQYKLQCYGAAGGTGYALTYGSSSSSTTDITSSNYTSYGAIAASSYVSSYSWTTLGGRAVVQMKGTANYTAQLTFTANTAGTYTIYYAYSTESRYDKLTIIANGTTYVDAVSGENTSLQTISNISLSSGGTVTVSYQKDGSVNSGSDCVWVGFSVTTSSSSWTRGTARKGGYGGYSEGVLTLKEPATLYMVPGGMGGTTTSTSTGAVSGGYNGGGSGRRRRSGSNGSICGGGGGGSDIRINSDSLYARVIVAGGGGGSAGDSSSQTDKRGGGESGSSYNTSYAGTQTTAGTGGSFGTGSNAPTTTGTCYGPGGGGGGWYGGGASTSCSTSSSTYRRYNGGGSGYVYTADTATNYPDGCLLNSNYYLLNASTTTSTNAGLGSVLITCLDIFTTDGEEKKAYIKTGINGSLPSGYIELEYIEKNGSQYIDTGFKPNNNTRVVIDLDIVKTTSEQQALFGGRTTYQQNMFSMFTLENNVGFQNDYGTIDDTSSTIPSLGRMLIDKNKNTFIVNKNVTYTHSDQTFSSPTNLYIGSVGYTGGSMATSYPSYLKIYSCKIYDNDTLIRDLIPVLRISDSKAGLYDLVNSTFYTDASGGNFIYNKTNYIDNSIIYYIKGDNPVLHVGAPGEITSTGVVATTNNMLYFDGNGYMSLSNNIITGTNDWSIDWWEYRLDATDTRAVYHSNYSSRSGYGLLIGYANGNKIYAYATTANSVWNIFAELSMGDLKVGEWVHRAMSRKGSNFYTFENGKLIATATSTASIAGNLTPTVGYFDYGTSQKFYGYIKHLRISNAARWTSDFIPPNKDMDYGTQYSKIENSYVKVPNQQNTSFSNDYYPLEYIESNGTQYINTGFTPNQNSAISIDVQCFGAHSTHAALCSARPSTSTSTNTIMMFLLNGTTWNVDRGGTNSNRTAFPSVSTTDRITVDLNKYHLSFNKGEVIHNFSSTDTFTCGGTLALLYDHNYSRYPMCARIYSCKIWDNDVLVRDYVPVLRTSDGMVGLYDKVNSAFYQDAAGGNFIYNTNDIDHDDYRHVTADSVALGGTSLAKFCPVGKINEKSIQFLGSGPRLLIPIPSNFSTSDFTIDWWEHYNKHTDHNATMIFSGNQVYSLLLGYHYQNGYYLYASSDGATWNLASMHKMGNVLLNQWVHRAVCRKGSNLYCFENGKLITTLTNFSSINIPTNKLTISSCWDQGFLDGMIDEVRISTACRWTYDFDPPTRKCGSTWLPIKQLYVKNNVPSDYTCLKYLRSDGNQYIDIDLIPNSNSKTVIDCILPTESSNSYYICGARESSYVDNYALQTTSGYYYSKHGPKESEGYLEISSVDHRMKFIKDGNIFTVDGNIGYCAPATFTCQRSMYIFACNSAGTVYGATPCTIYRVQVYQDGENLSRDLVPVLRNSDKKTGLYDLQNNVFYPNLGSTECAYIIDSPWEKIY